MSAQPATCFRARPVAVLGLGRSGRVAAEALVAGGAIVSAWDDGAAAREAAAARGIPIVDLGAIDWPAQCALVISPGIPHTHPTPHPYAARARVAGVPIIGDIEVMLRSLAPARRVGITGTNGKSTTTALIGHILNATGHDARVGGNIGVPVLAMPPAGPNGIQVLEMSSYQLEITPSAAFDVGVLLNITPDHLDRHGGMDGYVAAKRLIFRRGAARQCAVIGVDDPICAALATEIAAIPGLRTIAISASRRLTDGVSAADGVLVEAQGGQSREIADLRAIGTLPGQHNWQNAAAAFAVCRALGGDAASIAAAIASYPGLAHRQERVATRDGVVFINDSKATNADAAAKALGCYGSIWWIAGGRAKAGGIAALAPFFPRIRKAYLIGESAAAFALTLAEAAVAHEICETLDRAVAAATRDALADPGPDRVVLLSPACASFDQFADFEERGARFRALARAERAAGRVA